ncbi:MFS transporter [Frankia sp. Ag45/Mut15]|uniref:MFS transporter n=1 Tax=Frankia umida TaxID=573489 RepID=A0ABT0K206_9ACTN|nr:MFS transporter [Frankia umida]MCK9877527.1 MFS transporter [Frankia umida]
MVAVERGAARSSGPSDPGRRRWLMLVLGTGSQTVACAFVYGVPYLVPQLRDGERLSLAQAGLVVGAPTLGLVLALVGWGALADRYGERLVLGGGLLLSALLLCGVRFTHGAVALGVVFVLAGAAGASVFAASGRVVMGWFSRRERGLAMGVRQISTPLGMGIAALLVPPLAERFGLRTTVLVLAAMMAAVAVTAGLLVVDPPRPVGAAAGPGGGRAVNPYRGAVLWRIHGASALLVWPQFTISAFGLLFLVDVRGWSATSAGQVMALGQALGAASRIGTGVWSDRVGSRLRPMRQLAAATGVLLVALGLAALRPSAVSDLLLVAACGLTASTNGLSFTAIAERAGPLWAGRALGVQNTGQNVVGSLAPAAVGWLVGATDYTAGFLLSAALAGLAIGVIPAGSAAPGAGWESGGADEVTETSGTAKTATGAGADVGVDGAGVGA